MGKIYKLFHMDAEIGKEVLGLTLVKGDQAEAQCSEVEYDQYSKTLMEKGYKVVRVEQKIQGTVSDKVSEEVG